MYKRLVVVSDTALYKHNTQVFGFSAVVKELEFLQHDFEEIIWIGANRPELKDNGTLIQIKAPNINTILIPKMGGKSAKEVIRIFLLYPYLYCLAFKYIYKADVIHTRLPSHPAFIAVIISFLFPKKIWWHKFAGSWEPTTLPFFYKVQRSLLLKAKHSKVAINGFWKDQPAHCLSFENPCLYDIDLKVGQETSKTKSFDSPFSFVFIGRLDNAKGVDKIIEALSNTPTDKIKTVHFIGDSPSKTMYEQQASFLGSKVTFHGFLSTEKIHELLTESDFLVLPSKSEGFPKVIAEAACYGVIPITSDVGSIAHYINESNGFVWQINGDKTFEEVFSEAINSSSTQLKEKSIRITNVAKLFTFENYKNKLEKWVFSDIPKPLV